MSPHQPTPTTKRLPVTVMVLPLIFMLAGGVVSYFGARGLLLARESVGWPSVDGVVVASEVSQSRSSKGGTTYHAEVMYDYEVDQTIYSSNRIGYGDYGSSNPGHARQVVNEYPKGKRVTVFYQQENPEESCLEPGIQQRTFFLPTFGAVFFLAGLAMLIYLPRAIRRQQEKQEKRGV